VAFTGWINILLGITSFIAGIVFTVKTGGSSAEILENIDFVIVFHQKKSSKKELIWSLYILGVGLVLLGIFGICGGRKKNACLLSLFNCGNISGMVIFLTLGTISLVSVKNA
jgi:hypothetical protein